MKAAYLKVTVGKTWELLGTMAEEGKIWTMNNPKKQSLVLVHPPKVCDPLEWRVCNWQIWIHLTNQGRATRIGQKLARSS